MLNRFLELYEQGLLGPLDPVSCFDAKEIEKAFVISKAHLISARSSSNCHTSARNPQIEPSRSPRDIVLDPNAAYLIVGGSTGLGALIATWLVERGARVLLFISRGSGVTPESLSLYAELTAMGCQVNAAACSVVDLEQVQRAVEGCKVPVKCVFDLAMILRVSDISLPRIPCQTSTTDPRGINRFYHRVYLTIIV